MGENEWICEKCQEKNQMIPGEKYTCICVKCKTKNEVIEYMVTVIADDKYNK